MSELLARLPLAQPDESWRSLLVFFVVFVVVPLVGRVLKALQQRAESSLERRGAGGELARRRAERRAAEAEGETLWERLERGELAEPPPPAAPPPVVVAQPARGVEVVSLETLPTEGAPAEPSSGDRGDASAALLVLGSALESPAVREESLEARATAPLSDLFAAPAARLRGEVRARPALPRLGARDWRRAIVLAELLGPPVSDRRPG